MVMIKSLLVLTIFLFFVACSAKKPIETKPSPESIKLESDEKSPLIDERYIHSKMGERASDFSKCFDDEILRDKSFSVKKVMSLFTLSKDGSVLASGVVSIDPLTQEFKDCFRDIISSIKFTPISYEKPVLIFYPVEYRNFKKK